MDSLEALVRVASRWSDPDYPARALATESTLQLDNRFTEESIAFAVNQQMNLLRKEDLTRWAATLNTTKSACVGVLNPGNIPLVELQDFIAVVLSGHSYLGAVSSKSSFLFPAFVDDLKREYPELRADLVSQDVLFSQASRIIAAGTDETMALVAEKALQGGLKPEDCWLRGHRYSVAVLDGTENEDVLLDLAEDALMHEGMGCRSVAIVFAPENMPIDGVLDGFSAHRSLSPAHPATVGSLKLQEAYLSAIGAPHAFDDDYQFLISRGTPDVQTPGHVRWVPYSSITEPTEFIAAHMHSIQCVFSSAELVSNHPGWEPIGQAQRPALDWHPDGKSHVSFLRR